MPKRKTIISYLLIAIIILSISVTASADDHISTEPITTAIDPYEYGTSPDGLFVFLYHGYSPYFTKELDTSACVIDRLYVHNQVTNQIIELSDQTIVRYTETKDALYYVTSDQTIYRTDYTGSSHTPLYQCNEGAIKDLSSYLNDLVLIENNNKVVFVNSSTGVAKTVLIYDNLDWIFILSNTKLMVATLSGEYFVYDFISQQIVNTVSETESNNLITQAVLSSTVSTTINLSLPASVSYAVTTKVQENDMTLPLAEYPATLGATPNFTHGRPTSWFHVNGQEGCSSTNCATYTGTSECEGFARYAHDAYYHVADSTLGYTAWKTARHAVDTDFRFDGSQDAYKSFFDGLRPGAYVRYGKDGVVTDLDGVHSIVFVNIDDNGIWVYECNQDYDDDPTHGCGIHYQYYTFERLARQYQYATHYVDHFFGGGNTCNSTTKHTVECSMCSAYLVQSHTGIGTYTSQGIKGHKAAYNCCEGYIIEPHTIIGNTCVACGYVSSLLGLEIPEVIIGE